MRTWRVLIWVGLVAAVIGFLWLVRGILLPFILCLIIAALLEPGVRKLASHRVPRRVAVVMVVGAFFGVVAVIGAVALPTIARQVAGLTIRAQELTTTLIDDGNQDNFYLRWSPASVAARSDSPSGTIDRFLTQYGDQLAQVGLPSTRRGLIDQYITQNRSRIADLVRGAFDALFGAVTAVFANFFWLFLVPVIVTMLLFEMDTVRQRSLRWIPPALRRQTVTLTRDISAVFFSYLRGMSLLILYFSLVQTVMLYTMNLPYALLLGVIFGTFYLVPIIGNYISALTVWLIFGFSGVSGTMFLNLGNPWLYGGLVALIYVIIGGTFDNLVVPKLVGNSVGLSPVVSIFVVMCGQALFGLPGMVIAFPTAGAVKVILNRLLRITTTSDQLQLPAVPLRHRKAV